MTTNSLAAIPRPLAVKWIIGLTWIRLGVFALMIVLALSFVSPPEAQWARGVREGYLQAAGFDPATYGSQQAGQMVGGALIPAILSGLILIFVATRKLIALRIVAALLVVFSLAQPLAIPLTLAILVLTLRRSTKEFFKAAGTVSEPAA